MARRSPLLSADRGSGRVVHVARATAKRRFGPARVISRPARTALNAVAGSESDGGYVAWAERSLDGSFRIVGADLSRRLNVGRPVVLSAPLDKLTLPRVRTGVDGSTAVFWPTAARGARPPISWQLRSRTGHGRFVESLTLATVDRLLVTVDPSGAAVALIAVKVPRAPGTGCATTTELRSAIWTAGTSPRFRTLDSSCGGFTPMLAMSSAGAALAIWGHYVDWETGSLRISTRRPNDDFGAVETAFEGAPQGIATLLLDGDNALVAWRTRDWNLFAAFDDDVLSDTL